MGVDRRLIAAVQHLGALQDLAALMPVLEAEAVRWAVFKGPVLQQEVYPQERQRPYFDLDVLVHPHDLRRVIRSLEAHGIEPIDLNWEIVRRSRRSELSWRLPAGSLLDLHWHVLNHPAQRRIFGLRTERLLARRRTVAIDGLGVPTFDELDTILHVAVHGCLAGGHQERWLLDLALCLGHFAPAPVSLHERARHENVVLPLAVMIERAAQWLDPQLRRWAPEVGGGRAWAVVARRWSGRYDPGRWQGGRGSGRTLIEATRDTTASSVVALSAALARETRYQLARRAGVRLAEMDKGRLAREGGTHADREAYLAYVEGQGP